MPATYTTPVPIGQAQPTADSMETVAIAIDATGQSVHVTMGFTKGGSPVQTGTFDFTFGDAKATLGTDYATLYGLLKQSIYKMAQAKGVIPSGYAIQ